METNIFKLSDQYFKLQKRNMLIIQIFLPIFMTILMFFVFNQQLDFKMNLIILVSIILFVELLIIIQMKTLLKKIGENQITINQSEIIRKNKNFIEKIEIRNITKIQVVKVNDNEIRIIRIYSKQKNIIVFGIEKINEFYALLEEYSKPHVPEMKESKLVIDFNKPLILISYIVLFSIVMILGIKYYYSIYENIQFFLPVIAGILFLIFKPLSKSMSSRFKTFEIVLGVLLMVVGTLNIVLHFFLKP